VLLDFRQLHADYCSRGISGVLHVGAHLGEEAELYDSLGIKKVIWIEANPEVLPKIKEAIKDYPGQYVMQALVTDKNNQEYAFNVTNYDGMSSSIYPWGTHTNFSPDTVVDHTITLTSETLDGLAGWYDFSNINMLNIDIEGAGLLALKGATKLLQQIDHLYLEVQTEPVYQGGAMLHEYLAFLPDFEQLAIGMVEGQGWGDLLLRRKGY
jgi:FkbM family methyltransferase